MTVLWKHFFEIENVFYYGGKRNNNDKDIYDYINNYFFIYVNTYAESGYCITREIHKM